MLKSFRARASRFVHFVLCFFLICSTCPIQGAGFLSSGNTIILTGLDEQEANEIAVILNGYGIASEKKFVAGSGASQASTWSLSVPANKKMDSLAILNMRGLPRRRKTNTLLNLFSKSGLVSSDLEEKVRYQAGLADQIANTLRKLEGILDADVQLSIPDEESVPGAGNQEQKVTAAVYIKHTGILDDPNAYMQMKIKRLVSSSISNLEPDNVTIIGDQAVVGLKKGKGFLPELVSVWGVRVEKSSAFFFKIIVGSLIIIIGLFLVIILWMGWKLQQFFSSAGIKSLISLQPIEFKEDEESDSKGSEQKKGGEGEEKKTEDEEINESANLDSEATPKPPTPEASATNKQSSAPSQEKGTDRLPPRR
ncbi:EscJ/YscJ/HrcJ family type III secretion inner membrane ring protein [Candidatus Similichlamydia epinepheli]|uniref:EscJ/YscJ/HrcJ family type III secretion inner membrane ring protein n=1 Tax=Candidatus Similichlamydia epinepheli TaxID=1903953 RepID=UPI001300823D|nr:EscJ/YscJ/HrcJ family type III secretion inner membrane ring protein [Candidatus Similichlamydia epinepheli]